MLPLQGKTFGNLKVLERNGTKAGRSAWLCVCKCGKEKTISSKDLVEENTKSCGCLRKSLGKRSHSWKGYKDIGKTFWDHVKRNAKIRNIEFALTIEEAWQLFVTQNKKCALTGWDLTFERVQPSKAKRNKRFGTASLDRINVDKGYCQGNVQWVHKNINIAKNVFSNETFVAMCKAVSAHTTKKQTKERPIICLSGAFDVIHVGHVRMFEGAAQFGKVVVVLNSDEWVKRNRGFLIMPWHERRNVLLSFKNVDEIVAVDDSDDTVCLALQEIRPMAFGNGGLRTKLNTPERELCQKLGITMVYGLGGGERDAKSLDLRTKIKRIS